MVLDYLHPNLRLFVFKIFRIVRQKIAADK